MEQSNDEAKEVKPEDTESALPRTLADHADWVRAVVRDEIAKWEKRTMNALRIGTHTHPKDGG